MAPLERKRDPGPVTAEVLCEQNQSDSEKHSSLRKGTSPPHTSSAQCEVSLLMCALEVKEDFKNSKMTNARSGR